MANIFQNLLRGEPHDMNEIRSSLDEDVVKQTDFVSVLKEHHDFIEESISVLMDQDSTDSERHRHALRFFKLVEMHGRAEQETLYRGLQLNSEQEARLEGLAGQDEHDIAFQLEDELINMGYVSTWNEEIAAKVKVAAGLVKSHIKEEESTVFSTAENVMTDEELSNLCGDYLSKCRVYLEESLVDIPGGWVDQLSEERPGTML